MIRSGIAVAADAPRSGPPPSALSGRIWAYRRFWLLAALVFVLDQASKAWIAARLPADTYPGAATAIPVVPGLLYLIHVGNTGAAWSLFSGRSFALAALAGLTLVAIFLWRRTLGLRAASAQLCFGLLCGGIIGNLTDRIRHGHVVDFIDFHFGTYIYPTFNIADSAICTGVILYLLLSLRSPGK